MNPKAMTTASRMTRTVPRHAEIQKGSNVAIVMKKDQRCGHLTNGIVLDILTRGDHHRGIKVRLRDGRIGRVQSILSSRDFPNGSGEIRVGATSNVDIDDHGAVVGIATDHAIDDGKYAMDFQRQRQRRSGNGSGDEGGAGPRILNESKGAGTGIVRDTRLQGMTTDFRSDGYGYSHRSRDHGDSAEGDGALASLADYIKEKPGQRRHRQDRGPGRYQNERKVESSPSKTATANGEMAKDMSKKNHSTNESSMTDQMEQEFPEVDSALIAAICADYPLDLDRVRQVLRAIT